MTTSEVTTTANLDDLLFLNRNKSYGAYELRKNYDKRLTAALLAAVSFFALLFICMSLIPNQAKNIIIQIIKPATEGQVVITKYKIEHPATTSARHGHTNAWQGFRVTSDRDMDTTSSHEMASIGLHGTEAAGTDIISDPLTGMDGISGKLSGGINLPKKTFEKSPDINAEFPGGDLAYQKYLQSNIKYPIFARDNNIEGVIWLSLEIDEYGDVQNVTVLKGIGGGCDDEAVRVLKNMPRWKPGRMNGQNIPVLRYVKVVMKIN